MRKILVKLLAGALALVMLVGTFTACGSPSVDWTKPTLTTAGNGSVYGGFIGETENYLYFINGVADNTDDNAFGAPVKGALMVQDKKDLSKAPQVVVPKLFASTDYNAGVYIYDGRVYYGTPSTDKDSSGEIANSEMTFMSTKLDGTDTDTYFSVPSLSVEYRIVKSGDAVYIVYYSSQDASIISYNTKTGDKTTVAVTDSKAEGKNAVSLSNYKFLDGDALKAGYAVAYVVTVYSEDYYESAAEKDDYSRATEKYNKLYAYKAGATESEVIFDGQADELTYAITLVKGEYVYVTETDILSNVNNKYVKLSDKSKGDVVNADLIASGYLINPADGTVITLAEGVMMKRNAYADDKATREKIAIVSTASTLVHYDGTYVYYYNSNNNLARIKAGDVDANEERISEDTVATTWYAPQFITLNEKDYVFYADNSAKGASYVKYVDLDGAVKAKDTDNDDKDDLFYLEGHKFLAQRLDEDIAINVTSTINAIANELESGALVFEEVDGVLTVKSVTDAKTLYDNQTSAVKELVDQTAVQTLNNYVDAIKWANKYNTLKSARNLSTLSDTEYTALKTAYNAVKAEIEEFKKQENYTTVRNLLGSDLNAHYQKCAKEFTESSES